MLQLKLKAYKMYVCLILNIEFTSALEFVSCCGSHIKYVLQQICTQSAVLVGCDSLNSPGMLREPSGNTEGKHFKDGG